MDIEVLVTGQLTVMHNRWAVQVYVEDVGSQRNVVLIALGNSRLAVLAGAYAAVYGEANQLAFAPDIKDSRKMQRKIAELIS